MTSELSRRSALGAIAAPFVMISAGAFADPVLPAGSISVRDFGAKGDGITDDTDALTRAHESGKAVHYSRTDAFYRISRVLPVGASVSSDGAEIRIVGDGTHPKTIFHVTDNVRPIVISGLVLDGGYKGGTEGEWSHGIDLSGAKNILITDNTIRNPYGDCVYLGSTHTSVAPSNIRVQRNRLVNPRRCNIAIVCGENIVVRDNSCVKESDYVTSIDLEPDVNGFDFVRRVHILNNRFSTSGRFISAGVNNGTDNIDTVIADNHGEALEFFHAYENARLKNVTIVRNRFSATSSKGTMLHLESIDGAVSDNVDGTACADNYRSATFRNCNLTLARNTFCS